MPVPTVGVTGRQGQAAWVGRWQLGDLGQRQSWIVVPGIEQQAGIEQVILRPTRQLDAWPNDRACAVVVVGAQTLRWCARKYSSDIHIYSFT